VSFFVLFFGGRGVMYNISCMFQTLRLYSNHFATVVIHYHRDSITRAETEYSGLQISVNFRRSNVLERSHTVYDDKEASWRTLRERLAS
jgi:hypothetical protein